MSEEDDYKVRAKKQFDAWRKTWVRGTGSEEADPVYPYGQMVKYLIEPDHNPYLDLLGGGGFTPHGHGNPVIGAALAKMANQAYQTSDKGDHVYSATAEFMTKVEEHLPFKEPFWRFTSSENEAFLLLMEALDVTVHETIVVNGPRETWPHESSSRFWNNLDALSPSDPVWKQVSQAENVAVVVYPVNPDTFEIIDENSLALIDSLKSQKDITLVWDLSVTAGWTREPLDVHPEANVVLLGGALGGGLPFGAVVSTDKIKFPPPGRWSAGAGNALTSQLGLHALLLCEGDDVRDRYDLLAAAIGREIETIQTQLPGVVRDVTGGGLLGGLALNSVEEAQRVVEGLKERGVLVGSLGIPRGVVTFRVNRATDPQDVSELFDKVFGILTEEDKE